MSIKVSAPGKIHISGEHSVVYGQPALLAAINKRVFIKINKRKDKLIKLEDKKLKTVDLLSFSQIRQFSFMNKKAWKSNDSFALLKVGINKIYGALEKKPMSGFDLIINSQIPIGSGLGSSAALSCALTAAIFLFEGESLDLNSVNNIAFEIEKLQHGNPSGGDNTISCFGGFLKFIKKENIFEFSKLKCKKKLLNFLLVNSGKPMESTGEMVEMVFNKSESFKTKKIINDLGKLTKKIIKNLESNDFKSFKILISENEKLLEKLDVVGKKAKIIIAKIFKQNSAAKICGAGGVKTGSGMILAYSLQPEKLREMLTNNNLSFINIKLGSQGVRVEKD
ncbi:mevalonate kinase [Patescibacteria group bacterium]